MSNDERLFRLPHSLAASLAHSLKKHGHSIDQPKKLAEAVLQLSEIYTQGLGSSRVWEKPNHIAAYLAYFLPLNFLRFSAVLKETQRWDFTKEIASVIEIGSGPGTAHLAFEEQGFSFENYLCVEASAQAQLLHQNLIRDRKGLNSPSWQQSINSANNPFSMAVFSYSLNEFSGLPEWLNECEALLIVEPSTQAQSRRLLEIREKLMAQGFFAWAPCTHQLHCPLLRHSKTDWCYDRIFVEMPEWFLALESHLPMKNRSLTFSYLLLRKTPPPVENSSLARIIGDTQKEKGKTKQMICRGEEREFLTWLKRDGDAQYLAHGSLVEIPIQGVQKKFEFRPATKIKTLPIV